MVWRESTERAVGREDSQAWGIASLRIAEVWVKVVDCRDRGGAC